MDMSKEIFRFQMKEIEDYEGKERTSFYDVSDIKTITQDAYRLNKKIYLGLNHIQSNQGEWTNLLMENEKVIHELKNNEFEIKKELEQSIRCLIELSDLMMSIYKFALSQGNDVWIDSLKKSIEKNDEIISRIGISRIKALGERFDYNIHDCKGTKKVEKIENDTIIDVLREGYRYKGKISRSPEVIISE